MPIHQIRFLDQTLKIIQNVYINQKTLEIERRLLNSSYDFNDQKLVKGTVLIISSDPGASHKQRNLPWFPLNLDNCLSFTEISLRTVVNRTRHLK